MNVGEVIKIEEPLKQALADLNENRIEAESAFQRAAKWARQADQRFWGAIQEKYPELKNHDFSYDADKGEICVTRQRRV
jgi:hypothetical protein